MALRNILTDGNPTLNKVCRPVTAFDELEVSVLMDDRDGPELLRVDLVTLEDGSTYLYQVRTANEVALP